MEESIVEDVDEDKGDGKVDDKNYSSQTESPMHTND